MTRREAIATFGAIAALPSLAMATTGDLRDDMAILRKALTLHPGLYRYSTEAEVNRRLEVLERQFVGATTNEARYLAISRFLASIRCGHTYCNFFNQRDALAAELFDRRTRLPFYFEWINRRMIVTADRTGMIAPGTEVVSINGVAATAMLRALMPYARADGHNDAKRVSLLGVNGRDRIEYFDVFQGLVFGARSDATHLLSLRLPNGDEQQRQVPTLNLADRRAQMAAGPTSKDAPRWQWQVRPDGIALLTMPSWAVYDSKWPWRQWLDDRLNTLAGAKGLIIDLRDNEGGLDCGDAILARLATAPIADDGAERRVRFERTPADLDQYLDTWDKSFRTLGVGAAPSANGFYRLHAEQSGTVIAPAEPRLQLPVAALIGPVNSSATFQFAQKAQRNKLIRLIGEMTGGNQRGINGGAFFFVRLPASGIEFDLPLIGYFPPGLPPDAGLYPDVLVPRRPADIAAGRDAQMDAAVEWIGRA
uniref:S41 family peptidase n=2 Tax=Sphingomonas sp. GlSt437 TaxID=3389970 RepID=UPI003A863CF9